VLLYAAANCKVKNGEGDFYGEWSYGGGRGDRNYFLKVGGRDRGRTGDLIVANDALSQLSYSPTSSREILTRLLEVGNLRFEIRRVKPAIIEVQCSD
jgi:hypothetical protein